MFEVDCSWMLVILKHSNNYVPTIFNSTLITKMELRIYWVTVAYIHCKTTASSVSRDQGRFLFVASAVSFSFSSVGGMIWSSTLWTQAWTWNSTDHQRWRLESLSNEIGLMDFTLVIAKAVWNLVCWVVASDVVAAMAVGKG